MQDASVETRQEMMALGHMLVAKPFRDQCSHEVRSAVRSATDGGQVMAILYSWLSMSHRSLVIVLYSHQQILSLASMFATVF